MQQFLINDKKICVFYHDRKVYLILMLQLLVTFLFAAYFTYNEEAKLFAWRNVTLFYGCLITTFILMIVMACCENARRTAPLNFILLGIFTVAESILIGFIASFNEEKHVSFSFYNDIKINLIYFYLILSYAATDGGWHDLCHLLRPDVVCLSNKIRFHGHGNLFVRWCRCANVVWLRSNTVSKQRQRKWLLDRCSCI